MAFHNISHDILIHKIEMCEQNDNLAKQMQSWLDYCIKGVRLVDQFHPGKKTPAGVPKSSVLSHVLLNIIMNDLYEDVKKILSYLQISQSKNYKTV